MLRTNRGKFNMKKGLLGVPKSPIGLRRLSSQPHPQSRRHDTLAVLPVRQERVPPCSSTEHLRSVASSYPAVSSTDSAVLAAHPPTPIPSGEQPSPFFYDGSGFQFGAWRRRQGHAADQSAVWHHGIETRSSHPPLQLGRRRFVLRRRRATTESVTGLTSGYYLIR